MIFYSSSMLGKPILSQTTIVRDNVTQAMNHTYWMHISLLNPITVVLESVASRHEDWTRKNMQIGNKILTKGSGNYDWCTTFPFTRCQ